MFSAAQLIILDADGTVVDAFGAIGETFSRHGMSIGDLHRFQKRHRLFKYLGGLKEFPGNLKRQIGKHERNKLLDTLTEVYREEAQLYPCMPALIQTLIDASRVRVGLVTRNITSEPEETLRRLFARYGIDARDLDFLVHIPLREEKTPHFRAARERFAVNPARAYACGDEHRDFRAAVGSGMHPFIVSYGFEDQQRLTGRFGIPEEVISATPEELCARVLNALDLVPAPAGSDGDGRPSDPG
jgi:phosphoglycolate phosphatase